MKSDNQTKIYNWYLAILSTLVTLPFLAPILMCLKLEFIAKYIYFIYSFACHQFDHRSLHICDHQVGWCSRCTGIWTSVWLVALLTKYLHIKPVKFIWIIPFVVPMALDGGIQTIYTILDINSFGINDGMPLYISNNFVRFLTGIVFGTGLSLWISTNIWAETQKGKGIKQKISTIKSVPIILGSLILIYIGLIQVWNFSSPNYKPEGMLDIVVRTPHEDFFVRRRHATCPTSGDIESNYKNPIENLTAIDCFF